MANKKSELSVQKGLKGSVKYKSIEQELKKSDEAMYNEQWVEAMASGCRLDFLLGRLLEKTFLRKSREITGLFDCNILQKAKFAYALNLIDKPTFNDLKLINKIRNTFAHSQVMDFTAAEIQSKCKGLSTAKGHKVTTRTSYKLFKNAVGGCHGNIVASTYEQMSKNLSRLAT